MQKKPRLVIVGLDGATWDVINPLVEQGKLPAIKRIMDEGQSGTLRSVIPPITGPAWATILTGRNPGEHGIFEMTVFDDRLGRRRPISMNDWNATPLWEILNGRGLSTGLLCVPFTFPPPRVNGWIISGIMGTPKYDPRMFSPPSLFDEITGAAGEFPLAPPARVHGEFPLELLDRQISWTRDATLHLLDHHPTDVFMLVENYTDHVQHFFYQSRTHNHRGTEIDPVERAYVACDDLLGAIRERAGDETPLLVLSDHGFTNLQGFVNLGVALGEERSREASRVAALWTVWNWLRRLLPRGLSEGIRRRVKRARPALHVGAVGGYGSILEEVSDLDALEERLATIRHPDTGEPMIAFYRRDDLYRGPLASRAPVAVAFPAKGWQTKLTSPREGALLDGPRWVRDHEGTHALEGIIAATNVGEGAPLPERLEGVLDFCLQQCLGEAR